MLPVPLLGRVIFIISIVVQGNTIEFLERIWLLITRGSKPTIQRYTFGMFQRSSSAQIDTLAFFHIAEIYRINARAALDRYDWRFTMSKQRPLSIAEEWMGLYIAGTSAGAETA